MPEDPTTLDPQPDPQPDPEPDPDPQPGPEPDPEPNDSKEKNRAGYEQRQLQKQLEALRKENEGYKRRAEEERKAKLTEEQRVKEERDQLADENARLKLERLRDKIAAEMKLPPAMAARLIGTDEESLRADAEELAKFMPKPRAGGPTDPLKDRGAQGRIFKRSELAADPKLAASAEVKKAAAEGRVIDG